MNYFSKCFNLDKIKQFPKWGEVKCSDSIISIQAN